MIYEVRTYTFKPGFVGKWVAGFCEVFASGSTPPELGGLWHTDIGPLNEAVQIWMYDDLEHRATVNAKIEKEAGWPPNGNDGILDQDSQIFTPAPFSPKLGGGQKLGNIYEMRTYQFRPGSIPAVLDAFEPALKGGRLDLSPLAAMMYSDTGGLNVLMHLWPYESYAQRDSVRSKTKNLDAWPPNIGPYLLGQKNKILIPAACSPMA